MPGTSASPSRSDEPPSLLSTLGEEIIRIISPVSACMLLVVLLITLLNPSSSPFTISSIANMAYSEPASDSIWSKLEGALLNSLVFVALVTALSFVLVLLFYLRCTLLLKSYMVFSAFVVLALLGGDLAVSLLSRLRIPLDSFTFIALLLNFSVVGAAAVFASSKGVPIVVTQGYLVLIGVVVAYWFTLLPEWTSWALLVLMAVYDVAAVLLPGGPLRLLVEMAISRDEELPALVYEARPVEYRPVLGSSNGVNGGGRRLWRGGRDSATADSNVNSDLEASLSLEAARVTVPEEARQGDSSTESELTAPLVNHRLDRVREGQDENDQGIGLGSSGAIKLGLGDFIFYSVLVGRAAMYDFMTVYACYLAIMAGLAVTLLLLAFYRKALPALPVSIALGVLFYFLTRLLLEAFVVQCSINLLMF